MNIALVTRSYPPETGWGGIGTYIHNLAQGLVEIGEHPIVVSTYRHSPSDTTSNSIRVIRALPFAQDDYAHQLSLAKLLTCLIENDEIDVVEFPEYGAEGLYFQQHNPNFPTVVKLHGDTSLCDVGRLSLPMRISRQFYQPAKLRKRDENERTSASLAHRVIAPSRWTIRQCERRKWPIPLSIEVVPNPICIPNVTPESRNSQRVLFFGRLERRKGTDLIPRIVRQVRDKHPGAEFTCVGQDVGIGRESSESWIKRRLSADDFASIRFQGGIPHEAVPAMLQQHSIAAFLSTWESFGYTLLEAMSLGLACVSASVGGSQELGMDGRQLIKARRNPTSIAAAISKLLSNPTQTSTIGNAAKCFAHRCSAPLVANQMKILYSELTQTAEHHQQTAQHTRQQ